MKKFSEILKTVYGYGIMICLFAGGISVIGYIAALIIGGETATAICTFIYKKYFLWLIIGASGIVLLGLLAMYLSGESAMKWEAKVHTEKVSEKSEKK